MTQTNRQSVLRTVAGLGIALTGGVTTAAARVRAGARAADTIVDIAVENDDFTVLVAAVQETGLVDVLSGNRQLTVFAPTDEAFEDLADELGVDVEDLLELDNLEDILLYHVTSGRRYSESIVNAPRVGMLNGQEVDVDGTDLNDGQAGIVIPDIEASNGVIHVIDGVLLP